MGNPGAFSTNLSSLLVYLLLLEVGLASHLVCLHTQSCLKVRPVHP